MGQMIIESTIKDWYKSRDEISSNWTPERFDEKKNLKFWVQDQEIDEIASSRKKDSIFTGKSGFQSQKSQ